MTTIKDHEVYQLGDLTLDVGVTLPNSWIAYKT